MEKVSGWTSQALTYTVKRVVSARGGPMGKQRLTVARREIPLLLTPVSSPTLFALLSYFP
jgi:hypothetical protein